MAIVFKKGKNIKKLNKMIFGNEGYLQELIFENPELIPFEELKEETKIIFLCREFPLSVGKIDILGVDSDGEIYIIETKLYKNQDKRKVIAQVLDYGASLGEEYGNDTDSFIEKIKEITKKELREELRSKFGDLLDEEINEVIDAIKENISNGAFNFLVLMDSIPSDLKNLINFLNQNSNFRIYGLELEYYVVDEKAEKQEKEEIFKINIFGAESTKPASSASGRKRWDAESFFDDAKSKLSPQNYEAVRKLYEFSKEYADEIRWGTGPANASFNPRFYSIVQKSIYSVYSDGRLRFNFGWLDYSENTRRWREKFFERLKQLEWIKSFFGHKANVEAVNLKNIPVEIWAPHVDELINLLKESLKK